MSSSEAKSISIGKEDFHEISKFDNEDEPFWETFKRKAMLSPPLTAGITFGSLALGKMLYGFRHKPKDMKLSVYVIHSRMTIQGTVIGCLVLGMLHHFYLDQVYPRMHPETIKKLKVSDLKVGDLKVGELKGPN